jgi:tetratricopeptide (TPR) repeat protein
MPENLAAGSTPMSGEPLYIKTRQRAHSRHIIYMNRWIFMAALVLVSGAPALAQDVNALLKKAAAAEAAFREEEALSLYQQALRLQPHSVATLCHCCDLSCRIGNRLPDRDRRIDDFKAAYQYALAAYRLDSTNSEVNVMMAFSLGRLTLIQTNKERVETAVAIKRYAERALRSDPANYKAYIVLGRWNYEVSKLNFIERAFARWFYGDLPAASLGDAIRDYEKSLALRPDFMLNYYELAKALHRDGQDARAIGLLQKMDRLHDEMYDDRTIRAEGRKFVQEWSK